MVGSQTCCQHHKRNGSRLFVALHHAAEFDSVHHRHHHVGEDDVRSNLDNLLPGILTVHGLDDLIVGKHITHKLAEVIAIIYQKYLSHIVLAGRLGGLRRTMNAIERIRRASLLYRFFHRIFCLMNGSDDWSHTHGFQMGVGLGSSAIIHRQVYDKD